MTIARLSRIATAFPRRTNPRGEYEEVFPKLIVNSSSYLVIVTRGHRDDMRVLRWAVTTPARYVSMIGSKRKVIGVVRNSRSEGIPRSAFDRVFAPMGFEIGAITPEEIAVSVVAEMIAMRREAQADWRALSKSMFVNGVAASLTEMRSPGHGRHYFSAGASRRMGTPKALFKMDGERS